MTGTMLDVKIDRDDPALLHEQVAAQIRRAIADGEAKPGDRLPPARHLAAVTGGSTPTPSCARSGFCATRGYWSYARARHPCGWHAGAQRVARPRS